MYMGCSKVGQLCTQEDPLKAAYTSVTPQKGKPTIKYDKAGSTGMA
jgi:hypothetical protein